ncbi:MAG: tetratricopeptide repeat protein [Verrucomicrobia bacterium]|nr:tetratricopeptide repeat protein [Verrucomicrobiota bacterium]
MTLSSSHAALLCAAAVAVWTAGCSDAAKRDRHFGRAEKYFAAEDYQKALIEYQSVLRLEPTNRTVIVRVARIFCEQGSPLRALQVLQSADIQADDAAVRCRIAEFRIANGDSTAGRSDLMSVLAESPTNGEALRLLAVSAAAPAEQTNTAAYLRRLGQSHPDSPPILLAESILLLRRGQVQPAEQILQRALQLDPNLVHGHVQMAQVHLQRTNLAAAEQSFSNAVRLASYRSPIRIAYAESKAARAKPDEARAILDEVLSHAPDYLPASLLLARIAMQERKLDEAMALASRVVSRDPLNLNARQLRSQLHVVMRQPEKAALEWEQFDQSLRPNPLIKLLVARAHVANGDSAKAIAAVDQAIRLGSNRLDAVAIESTLLRARLDIEGSNPVGAIESLERLLVRTNVTEARVLLIDAQRGAGRLDDAAATCQALVRDVPDNPSFEFVLGMLQRQRGRVPEARAGFLRSLELAPGNPMALYQIVDLEIAATNAPAAMKIVQTELARTNTAALRYLEGRVHAAQRQWPEAEAALKQSLALNSSFSLSYQLLSSIYLANTNLAGAARELEDLVAQRTNDVRSLMILATLYDRMDQPEKARDKYEQLVQAYPQFVPALNNLAYVYTERLPRLDRALELAQKARQLAPEEASVADTLGWILHKRGDHRQALILLREAAGKNPEAPEIQYHAGMAYYMLGQTDAARTALERAAASPEPFTGKAEAQRQLAVLGGQEAVAGADDLAALEKLVQSQPRDLTARTRLAAGYETDRQFAKAAAEYEEILRQNPRAAQAALRLALLNVGPLNNQAKALELARKARELAPGDPEATLLLGRMTFQTGDHGQAYGLLQTAAQRLPQRADVQFDLGWAAFSVGRIADASQAMQRALEVEPGFHQADAARTFVSMTGLILNPDGLAGAEPQIQEALNKDPNHGPALMAQAALMRARGNTRAAMPIYEKILGAFPRFTPASREIGLILAADPAQAPMAYDLLVKAREAYPDDADVARALGLLSYGRKDYRYAITLLQSYLRGRPNDPEALFYLGMSQHQSKQAAPAREQLQKAIDAGLKEPLLSEAKKIMSNIQP